MSANLGVTTLDQTLRFYQDMCYRFLYFAVQGNGQVIKTDLNKNLGLLTLNLGKARLQKDHWNFEQTFRLDKIKLSSK